MKKNSCKHYSDGKCYCTKLFNTLGWDWLKEQGWIEVPAKLRIECPVRSCGFIESDLKCDTCWYFEEAIDD